MRNASRTAIVLLLTPFMLGCGVIFGGTRQSIQTMSSPEGASVTTAPPTIGYTTPTTLNLERKNEYVLTFSSPGYTSQQLELQRSMRTDILVADIALTGLTRCRRRRSYRCLVPVVAGVRKRNPDQGECEAGTGLDHHRHQH